ncbi:MAG: YebC/PmpR family DNA-binding transcriptional regulator [Bacteroidales bacterium]|nr:YebC/PmpR family DNA-binding transcriptional regulator [Bacteroidales bacterium]MDD3892872.1 YebC/PmpR family DNA-binding transcriptional regulator [Bacteroidales bacterium]
MGRAFEYRKARKLKRWGNMARVFTRIGREIMLAAKAGGPDPDTNPRLRLAMQNAKSENVPKENVERAIKKATDKDTKDYKEVVYEGKGPHGVAIVVETATDNPTRTVANVRSYFTKFGGTLGTTGMLDYLFDRKCLFQIEIKEGVDLEELELELIDFGVEEIFEDDGTIMIYAEFSGFGPIQKYLEDNKFEIKTFTFERIPNENKELNEEDQTEVEKLIEKLEEDDDVTNVFHNMH